MGGLCCCFRRGHIRQDGVGFVAVKRMFCMITVYFQLSLFMFCNAWNVYVSSFNCVKNRWTMKTSVRLSLIVLLWVKFSLFRSRPQDDIDFTNCRHVLRSRFSRTLYYRGNWIISDIFCLSMSSAFGGSLVCFQPLFPSRWVYINYYLLLARCGKKRFINWRHRVEILRNDRFSLYWQICSSQSPRHS